MEVGIFKFFQISDIDCETKDDHLKQRFKLRLNDYVGGIEKLRTKKSKEEENTLILDILIGKLKQKIEDLWVEGCPFNKKCRMVEGNAEKYCRSDGTMECGIYIVGREDEAYSRDNPVFCCNSLSGHRFNPYKTRIERILLRFFILDHM